MNNQTKIVLKGVGIGLGVVAIGGLFYHLITKKGGVINNQKIDERFPCSHMAKCDLPQATKAENNLKNIGLLIDNNIGLIELDVQITRDGVPVLFHDKTLNTKTNGSGTVQEKTWNELKNVSYDVDNTQGITKLEDALYLLKKSKKDIIFQLDKCEPNEIKRISALGLLKGIEKQILCKSSKFIPDKEYLNAGVMYMPIIPASYVGKMNNERTINEIAEKCKDFDFCELSFGTSDTYVLNGKLAEKLKEVGCSILGIAVTGVETTNPNYYDKNNWGDKLIAWKKYFENINCTSVMTDKPIAMKQYLDTLK